MPELIRRAEIEGAVLSIEEIEELLTIADPAELDLLWQAANRVRAELIGSDIWMRGLLEFSNVCRCNCLYCGLRADNTGITRYRMSSAQILAAVDRIAKAGIGTVVLQSGEDPYWTAERLVSLIEAIKRRHDMAVTLSIGNRTESELAEFRRAGADRFLIRHETANPSLYKEFHPDSTLEDRVRQLRALKDMGFETGSGCLVGLPGQTTADLSSDIALARELNVDMFGVGPFIPHPDTPLREASGGTALMTYKMIAVARLVLRDVHIPVTTALSTLEEEGREKGWARGANIVMPNATPSPYRAQYELYKNKRCIDDTLEHCLGCLSRRISSVNRTLGYGRGGSLKKGGQ
ncbi:MAG: [FeFe] hydrogenase H-cluster radical SAM maturase HydE [Peptococcaceae bacterium]|nr:[FeFe] hydrogenase H-cluster radical SAM maturase HydE [Peptococcaceae bacterium]